MNTITPQQKYSQPEVVTCWQNLSRIGLQKAEWVMVNRYLPPDGPLLDAGCGAGRAVTALGQAGFRVTGVDLSPAMLHAGRALTETARFSGGNLLALPLADGSFAAVIMFFGALQHLPGASNRRRAMAEMARVVRPGGRLVLGLDNLAPTLTCYGYWAWRRLTGQVQPVRAAVSTADAVLWNRAARRVHPLVWHSRGIARTLRWRTWPGLVDLLRRFTGRGEPGDMRVAQFSLASTPGKIFYHVYQVEELINEAAGAGWRLLGWHSGTELAEERVDPPAISRQDKQLFFAFTQAS